jgi:hypothetical protein
MTDDKEAEGRADAIARLLAGDIEGRERAELIAMLVRDAPTRELLVEALMALEAAREPDGDRRTRLGVGPRRPVTPTRRKGPTQSQPGRSSIDGTEA